MKATSSFKQGAAKLARESAARRFGRALQVVDELLQEWPDNPQLLVWRAELVQLQEGDDGPGLSEAKASLQRAAELQGSPDALIELGHFLFAVEDDARAACKQFDRAITQCKKFLKDALLGKAKALAELERRQEALACLAQAYWLESQNGKGPAEDILASFEDLRKAQ
jgi:tetratricopeptide (TPR) repeat protein